MASPTKRRQIAYLIIISIRKSLELTYCPILLKTSIYKISNESLNVLRGRCGKIESL